MRLRCPALILLLMLAACGSSSAASEQSATSTTSQGSTTCGPPSAQTLAVSPQARVYLSNGQVYGCTVVTGHSYHLGAGVRSIRQGRVGVIAVAGRYAGYGLSSFGVDTVSAQVIVRNLADGRILHDAAATSRILVESFQSIDSIVVKPGGAVAWISEVGSVISHNRYLEVHRLDSRGPALLDSGTGIVSRSLRLHGSTVTWRDGSVTRSATLR
jgi:hypothetical protein